MDGSGVIGAAAGRDRAGRFAPGVSGNPAGKRKGTQNRMTLLKLALDADESGEIARVVIDRALAGDMVAARFCLGLIVPKPRGRAIELDLPAGHGLDDIVAAFDVTVAAMAAGEITPDEALTVTKVLDRRRRAIEARARQQERAAKRGRAAAPEAERDAAASERPAEISEAPRTAPAGAPAPAPILAQADVDLHPACNPGTPTTGATTPDAAEEAVDRSAAPPRPPLPGFGSACIRPEFRRRASRAAAPIRTPAGPDRLALAPRRESAMSQGAMP